MSKANGELVIEDGIPIPAQQINGVSATLRTLKVGQSVLLAETTTTKASQLARHALGKGNYVTRTADGGVRVWRTA